jgi:hypothetical protein
VGPPPKNGLEATSPHGLACHGSTVHGVHRQAALGRRWLAVEKDETYAKDSELRFRPPEGIGAAKGQSLLFGFTD